MGSASGVRMGGAYVEIFAKDGKFQQALTRVENRLKATAQMMRRVGTNMALGGAALGVPMVMAVKGAARFQDALLAARASAGLTLEEVAKLEKKAMELSKAGSGGPGEIAEAFTELVKAGVPLEAVLADAGEAVVKFAANAGIDTKRAAEIAADAMNVFGESTTAATDILKAAADSSSTDIDQMTQAFSQSAAVAGQANQSMHTLATAIALMASQGVKGSDAGTSIKTMLMKLINPSNDAQKALADLGLSVASFIDQDTGQMKSLPDIIDEINTGLAKVDPAKGRRSLAEIFGTDAVRAAQILTKVGSQGFKDMSAQMAQSMTNAEAFDVKMSGINGSLKRMSDAVERLQTAFSKSLGNTLQYLEKAVVGAIDALAGLLTAFPILGKVAAYAVGGVFALGVALTAGSFLLDVYVKGLVALGNVLRIIPALFTPVGAGAAVAVLGIGLIVTAARQLSPEFKRATDAIGAALSRLDFGAAWQVMATSFSLALTQMAASVDGALRQIQGFIAATSSFIGDKLIEGLDRFMGLFGTDIIAMQTSLQRLGVYLRAAFDWKFAVTGMSSALDAIDAEAEKARQRAPTADARANDRATGRRADAAQREDRNKEAAARWDATIKELGNDVSRAIDKANGKPGETADQPQKAVAELFRKAAGKASGEIDNAGGAAGRAEPARGAGVGQTTGTFGAAMSSGDGLAVGPELGKLEDPARETAVNTAATVDAINRMAGNGDVANATGDLQPQVSDNGAPATATADLMSQLDAIYSAGRDQNVSAEQVLSGQSDAASNRMATPAPMLTPQPIAAAAVVLPQVPQAAQQASAGIRQAQRTQESSGGSSNGFEKLAALLQKGNEIAEKNHSVLKIIGESLKDGGLAFA